MEMEQVERQSLAVSSIGVVLLPNVQTPRSRKPRGRPRAARTSPAPDPHHPRVPNASRSHVLEIASGADIVDAVDSFSRRRQRGVSVLSGTGVVATCPPAGGPPGPSSGSTAPLRDPVAVRAFLPAPPAAEAAAGLTVYSRGAGRWWGERRRGTGGGGAGDGDRGDVRERDVREAADAGGGEVVGPMGCRVGGGHGDWSRWRLPCLIWRRPAS
ncbi:uncharacterized protein A4U43_C07F1380 [Asparagus officinalis]|uniref:PPC domain-containing protein n=1 Tax=Asparagus officinalis TaxID=4686 RepID=A0A5P1EAG2_ASPOF|nr:uncharacterized protein A4U43_C07F1380 [Asparagus officinalis]